MAVQSYTVEYRQYGTNVPAAIALTNVQNISINVGRQRQLDSYNASTATIVCRYPTGYASPIADLVPNALIRIKNTATGYALFCGIINNVEVQYGIPYAGGVGNADYLTITCEGGLAQFARYQGENYAMPADSILNNLDLVETVTSLNVDDLPNGSTPMPNVSATVVSGTWADYLNLIALSVNARINDVSGTSWDSASGRLQTFIISPFGGNTSTINFSDTTNNATNQVYNAINFSSYADNYYTEVTVKPEDFAEANVSVTSSFTRSLLMNTINSSVSAATDYANYLLGNYSDAAAEISSISCLANAQTSFQLDKLITDDAVAGAGRCLGYAVNVAFRGTTVSCVIEGYSITATPESAQYTFYLSGNTMNNVLLLDNAVFGTLDNNRLGY